MGQKVPYIVLWNTFLLNEENVVPQSPHLVASWSGTHRAFGFFALVGLGSNGVENRVNWFVESLFSVSRWANWNPSGFAFARECLTNRFFHCCWILCSFP